MTEPITVTVAFAAFALAFVIAFLVRPRRPELDGERWFKLILATLHRGRCDAKGATVEEWEQVVDHSIFYHPQGRYAEVKVEQLKAFPMEQSYLPGEQALMEQLSEIRQPEARWQWLFQQAEAGRLARFADPAELGVQYRPSSWMGSEVTWDAIAQAGTVSGGSWSHWLEKDDVKWLILSDSTLSASHRSWGQTLCSQLGNNAQLFELDETGLNPDGLGKRLLASSTQLSDRFAIVGIGRAAVMALRALVDEPVLRDKTLAFVSIGGTLEGYGDHPIWGKDAFSAWRDTHFNFVDLDTEMDRETAYFSVGLWDQSASPAGLPNLSISEMRFPEIADERAPVEGVHIIDLGLTRATDGEPYELLARALWLTVTCWIRARVLI